MASFPAWLQNYFFVLIEFGSPNHHHKKGKVRKSKGCPVNIVEITKGDTSVPPSESHLLLMSNDILVQKANK